MTLNEFKAWFEGYVFGVGDSLPTKQDWEEIVNRIRALEETQTPKLKFKEVPYHYEDPFNRTLGPQCLK